MLYYPFLMISLFTLLLYFWYELHYRLTRIFLDSLLSSFYFHTLTLLSNWHSRWLGNSTIFNDKSKISYLNLLKINRKRTFSAVAKSKQNWKSRNLDGRYKNGIFFKMWFKIGIHKMCNEFFENQFWFQVINKIPFF